VCVGGLTGFVKKAFISIWNKEANEGKSDDVEEGDPPKDLLDGGRQGLTRISGLGGGKTNKLGATESESGSDKDGAETFEAIMECARVVPVFTTNIATGWRSAATD
jgi:hypothetical protein